jgi:hypothetical protein
MVVKRSGLGSFRIHFKPKRSEADSTGLCKRDDKGVLSCPNKSWRVQGSV